MSRPIVLIVQPALAPYRVGLFARLQKYLPQIEVRVLAANLDHNGVLSVRPDGASFHYAITGNSRMLFGTCWQPKVFHKILFLSENDTLIITGNPRYVFNLMAASIARLRGIDVIWWGQLWSLSTSKNSLVTKIKIMNFVASKILLYTSREARLLAKILPAKKIYYLNNGIDNSDIIHLRKPYKAAERPRRILFLGRLTPKANIGLLLHAIAATQTLQLEIIGGNSSPELVELIETLEISNRVRFHGETTDEQRIAEVANFCLFFVYPGAVGLSLIHAFNYGLPALVHDERRKHMPEIAAFREGNNGETFIYNDYKSLAKAMSRMSGDESKLDRYSESAIQVSAKDFNTDVMARRFADAIRAI